MLIRDDFPYQGQCDVCRHMADLSERSGRYVCLICSIHEGSLPEPTYGTRVVVTEVVNPCLS